MKYGDELDRVPAGGLSRRRFLAAGGQTAARAAWLLLPGAAPLSAPDTDLGAADEARANPERREG